MEVLLGSRPLVALEEAISAVADGNYDLVVPHRTRGDEIGSISKRLEGFRARLKDGEQVAIDSAYKSAAFEGSSAAMMVANKDFEIVYCNPAAHDMLDALGDVLGQAWPGVDRSNVLGKGLKTLAPIADKVEQIVKDGQELVPVSAIMSLGQKRIELTLNAALDTKNEMIGAVLEWTDKTETIQNTALIGGVDSAMMRAEFASDGTILGANDNFLNTLHLSRSDLHATSFSDIFSSSASSQSDPLSHDNVYGRYEFLRCSDRTKITSDGSFVAVKGVDGHVEKSLFLGMDVTEAEAEKRQSEELQASTDAEQRDVVAELGLALKALSEGRLDAEIETPFGAAYEALRQDFNSAVVSLRSALSVVSNNAASIRSETTEIASAADDLSRRTERQAATLEETAAALDQITSSVRSQADGAKGASEKANAAQSLAEEGGDVAREAVSAMGGIKASSQEISKITSVIDDIAFQTNLLALNAGVEAARAGDAGRGFAVVATEVRALAQRSSDAASEINELISASEHQVRSGVDLVDRTGTALSAIVDSISEISGLVSNIAASTQEQASGLNEINSAVTELDQVTQQNAAMFEETTAASHALTQQTNSLADAVSRFQFSPSAQDPAVLVEPSSSPTATSEPVPYPQETIKPSPAPKPAGTSALAEDLELQDEGWEEF